MSSELSTLRDRVRSLERSGRRAQALLSACLIVLVVVVLSAAQSTGDQPKAEPVTADQAPADSARTIRASAFELIDSKGKVRGAWKLEGDKSPSFALIDSKGRMRLHATLVNDSEVYLRMRDNKGVGRITHVVDRADHPHFLLHDTGNKPRMHMAIANSGAPSLIFIDADGGTPAGLGVHADGEAWVRPAKK